MSDHIFDKISKKAHERGISINSLEAKAGVSTGSIYKWNKVSPTIKSLAKVTAILGCTIDELLNETEER